MVIGYSPPSVISIYSDLEGYQHSFTTEVPRKLLEQAKEINFVPEIITLPGQTRKSNVTLIFISFG